jgi:hypothetical protein
VDAELEALQTLTACIRDLVLDNANGPSSLAAYLSMVMELLEGWINATVGWGTQLALVATLS